MGNKVISCLAILFFFLHRRIQEQGAIVPLNDQKNRFSAAWEPLKYFKNYALFASPLQKTDWIRQWIREYRVLVELQQRATDAYIFFSRKMERDTEPSSPKTFIL